VDIEQLELTSRIEEQLELTSRIELTQPVESALGRVLPLTSTISAEDGVEKMIVDSIISLEDEV